MNAETVRCPVCAAPVGEPCATGRYYRTGPNFALSIGVYKVRTPHADREQDARRNTAG